MKGEGVQTEIHKYCKVALVKMAEQITRAQLFETNDVVSYCSVKPLIIKYDIYSNIFAENMWVAFAKASHIFSAKIPVN